MRSGYKVLYAGVGSGEDAALLARSDVELTILDTSTLMLEKAARRLQGAGVQSPEIICCDVLEHGRMAYYDIVVANFFLDIFSELTMKEVMAHLVKLLKPGGKMLIGDYSFPSGRWPQRAVQRVYYWVSMSFAWLFGGSTLHPVYDYPRYFRALDLRTVSIRRFRVSVFWPAYFETITAQKGMA
jgi:demethylmenaquinone methyltransferase/2-methoxy-6-polyprenyl-1,4-benzoquinol methylase